MADVKHTPGEWTPEFGETYNVRAPDGGRVATCTNLKGRNGLGGRRTSIEVAANALLIAAAPELLDALIAAQTVLRYLPDMTTNWGGERETMSTRQAEARVIAAIAKATGAARATEGSAT